MRLILIRNTATSSDLRGPSTPCFPSVGSSWQIAEENKSDYAILNASVILHIFMFTCFNSPFTNHSGVAVSVLELGKMIKYTEQTVLQNQYTEYTEYDQIYTGIYPGGFFCCCCCKTGAELTVKQITEWYNKYE